MKYTDSLSTLLRPFSGWFDNSYSSVMKTDVKANDREYTLSVDLPGVSKNDIEISLQDGSILGLDARGYLVNHHQRQLPSPQLSPEQAQQITYSVKRRTAECREVSTSATASAKIPSRRNTKTAF